MTTRRICIYCQKWESGGIESFLYNMLTHMDRTGLEIDLVADKLCPSVFTQPLEALGVRFVELSGSLRNIGGNRRRFARLLAQRQYDTVHVNAFQGLSLAMLQLAKQAGVPIRIAHSHGAGLRPSLTKPLKYLLHRWGSLRYGSAATVRFACSETAAAFLFGAAKDYAPFPNGIETGRFAYDSAVRKAVRKELGLDNCFVVGHVGRFDALKNQTFLVDIMTVLQEPSARLLLVGDGPQKRSVMKKTEKLGVSQRILFAGVRTDPERLYQAMDVFALPSRREGFGIVAVEAQTAGLPVLCSDGVPHEAMVTPLAKQLPLSAGPAEWAHMLQCMKNEIRPQSADAVRQAGYDVTDGARRLEQVYKGRLQ